jgi:hypothetical protein
MKFRVEVVCLNNDGEQRCSVMEMERADLAIETLGLSVAEGKTVLRGVQDFVASQQALEDPAARLSGLRAAVPEQDRRDPHRQDGVWAGGGAESTVEPLLLPERRAADVPAHGRLAARADQSGVLYLETKWASLIPFREGDGSVERSAAGGRDDESRNSTRTSARPQSGWRRNWAKNGSRLFSKSLASSRCRMGP